MKSIYHYSDHKKFLEDWFLDRKSSPSGFSYERFSKLAGLGSPNYMKLVIEGKRNLTVANVHLVSSAMKLSFEETQYFESLVLYGQSKTGAEKSFYKRRQRELRKSKPSGSLLLKGFDLIAQWYFPAVVVVLNDCRIIDAISAVKSKTGLEERQIQQVIGALKKHDMLHEEGEKYRVEFSHFLVHDQKSMSEANRSYLREQFKIGAALLEKKYSKGPKFYSHTFTIAQDRFAEYAERIDSFLEGLTAESNSENPDEVVQLNIQFFRTLDRL